MRPHGTPGDRRLVSLQLTDERRALVDRVRSHRRRSLQKVVEQMNPEERRMLVTALSASARSAGEAPDEAVTAALGIG